MKLEEIRIDLCLKSRQCIIVGSCKIICCLLVPIGVKGAIIPPHMLAVYSVVILVVESFHKLLSLAKSPVKA